MTGLLAALLLAQTFDARWECLKQRLSNEDLYRLLWAVPKGGDIHVHHEFSIPMSFWIDGAIKGGYLTRAKLSACKEENPLQWITLRKDSVAKLTPCQQGDFQSSRSLNATQREEWLAALTLTQDEGKDEFFEKIVLRVGDLENDPKLIADALHKAQHHLRQQNAIYLETQLDPRGFHGMNHAQAAAYIRRRYKPRGVVARFQVSTVRFLPDAEVDLKDGFAFVHQNHDLWKGVNLVGREDNPAGSPQRFTKILSELRQQYPEVALSLHAGESATPDTNVAQTLALGATRIGHGINAWQDPRAMQLLKKGPYLIEINLVSNLVLGYTPDLTRHPLPRYLREQIPVCLNTDDGGVYGSNLTDDYFAAVALFNLTWKEVVELGRNSLQYSFAEPQLKSALLKRYEANVAYFEKHADRILRNVHAEPSALTPRLLNLRKP